MKNLNFLYLCCYNMRQKDLDTKQIEHVKQLKTKRLQFLIEKSLIGAYFAKKKIDRKL